MDPTVTLPYQKLVLAATQGAMHTSKACRQGYNSYDHGGQSSRTVSKRLGDSVLGELGEVALSQHLNLPKTSSADFSVGDVADGMEVRTTEHPDGHLIVYDTDPDARFFLATVSFGQKIEVSLPGWMLLEDATRPRYKRDSDPPAYWVPQEDLHPINPHK